MSRATRATITGSALLVVLTYSSLIQGASDIRFTDENQKLSDGSNLQKGNFILTITTGFILMRVYKSIANVVLSGNVVMKVVGNVLLGVMMVGGTFGSLFSASN